MIIIVQKPIVTWKLGRELLAAGISHNGMSLFENQLEIYLVDPQQAGQVEAVVDAHDGIDTVAERLAAAEGQVRAVPGWSRWSEAEALDWWASNLDDAQVESVETLADATALMKKQNAVLKSMARLLIALRNRQFPQLPEE